MDEETLRDMRAGDEGAFLIVFRSVQPRLLRYLTPFVGSDDAADVAAEAWAQAIRDLHRFKGTMDGFRGWITTIARNRALDLLRSQSRHPFVDVDPSDPSNHAGTTPSAEADAMDAIGTAEALTLIGSLPPEQAEAVLLRTVMALDAKTAARILGRRPGAVRTAAYRGLKGLEERLSDIFEGSDAESMR